MSFDQNWEKNIYAEGQHLNKYPYGELVSVFFNSLKYLDTGKKDKSKTNILELGCGAGNNLWFFAENGYATYGIDGSKSACIIAQELCDSKKQIVTIQQAYFNNLPFEDSSVDIIIDRESTCCGTKYDIKKWWEEANRVLKKGGLVVSFKFSDKNPDLLKIQNNILSGIKVEENTFKDIEEGTFKDTGIVHFTSYDEIFEVFNFCDIKYINHHTGETIYDTVNNQYNFSEYIIVGVKK
jgi:ubiquinone/menaquinone biosynthesis C-methylase UbiE